jgi:hypothetical protein
MMRRLPDTLLMLGGIWRWMFRCLTSARRILTTPGLITLAGILTALTDTTLAGIAWAGTALAGIALPGILLLSECQIICLQLLVLAGVDTPLMPSADMRRGCLAY